MLLTAAALLVSCGPDVTGAPSSEYDRHQDARSHVDEDVDSGRTGAVDVGSAADDAASDAGRRDVADTTRDDGAPCLSDSQCTGGTCITQPQWADGYCTTVGCSTRRDCARADHDNRCLVGRGQQNVCVRLCDTPADCRDGYACQPIGAGQTMCAPDTTPTVDVTDLDDYPFEITCGLAANQGRASIDYTVADDTVAYMVTPFTRDGRRLEPTNIALPDGSAISFGGQNRFQLTPSQLFGFINPIVTPAVAAFDAQLQGGSHTLEMRTESADICSYLLEEDTAGSTIDLNIYLVGLPELDADSASTDPDMQAVLERFGQLYGPAGITVGHVAFHDVVGQDAQAYQIIRSEADLKALVSTTTRPEGGLDEALSANIFFVKSMQLSLADGGGGAAIGVSEGLPGAAGLHGTPSSGVVFTAEYIGEQVQRRDGTPVDGNQLTGMVMAHEVGHFLGLFHSSEQNGRDWDPLDDTPECTDGFPADCPDLNNLMFPLAGNAHTQLSAGQIHMIQANPLTKE